MLIGTRCGIICESLGAVLNGHHEDEHDDGDDNHPKNASWTELHLSLLVIPFRPQSYHTSLPDPVWDIS